MNQIDSTPWEFFEYILLLKYEISTEKYDTYHFTRSAVYPQLSLDPHDVNSKRKVAIKIKKSPNKIAILKHQYLQSMDAKNAFTCQLQTQIALEVYLCFSSFAVLHKTHFLTSQQRDSRKVT